MAKSVSSAKSYLAPNGKKSNLNPVQYELVRTKEFKNWFGDWEKDPKNSSKVIDSNGEPLVVFHGAINNFTIFDRKKLGYLYHKSSKISKTGGFFFTDNYVVAKSYVNRGGRSFIENIKSHFSGKILECFLNIRSIYVAKGNENWACVFNNENECFSTDDISRSVYTLMDEDGVLFEDVFDSGNIKVADVKSNIYVAFESNQIKLADGSNKTFDPANPDIRYADGGVPITNDGKKGGLLSGKAHSECDENGCGIKAIVTDKNGIRPVELESEESIINKRSMTDIDIYSVTGTPAQIASAINSIDGNGVVFAEKVPIKKVKKLPKYNNGGKFSSTPPDLAVLLDDLFKDHCFAFEFAQGIYRTTDANLSENTALLISEWNTKIKSHFSEEENDLFPLINDVTNNFLISELIKEHMQFEDAIEGLEGGAMFSASAIRSLAKLLMLHIQKEDGLFMKYGENKYSSVLGLVDSHADINQCVYCIKGTVSQIRTTLNRHKSTNDKLTFGGMVSAKNIPNDTFVDDQGRNRFEIDDSTSVFDYELLYKNLQKSLAYNIPINMLAKDLLIEWDGYNNYPTLANINVEFDRNYSYSNSLIMYDQNLNRIIINSRKFNNQYGKRYINETTSSNELGRPSVLSGQPIRGKFIHELQHAIQREEGIPISKSTPYIHYL